MRKRPLGNTGLRVTEVGFGAWAIGGNDHGNSYGPTDDATSSAAVARAVELGCNFFDTADVYGWGHSEEILGEALREAREAVHLATKVGGDFYHGGVRMNFKPDYVRFALERSLERLQTDYVDLYQLHNPPLGMTGDAVTYRVFEELKAEGKILHYGVSIHEPMEGLLAMDSGRPEVLQLPFSLFRQAWDMVLDRAAEEDVGIIAREPLGNGFLTGKYRGDETFPPGDIRASWPPEMVRARALAARSFHFLTEGKGTTPAQAALRYVLSHEAVSTTIPGIKTPAMAEENLAAAGTRLTDDQLRECEALYVSNFGL